MKSPRDKQFYEYKDGSPMSVEDLIYALLAAISIMAKEISFDFHGQGGLEKCLRADYKRKLEVLEKIKESYELAKAMSAKPKLSTVKKR